MGSHESNWQKPSMAGVHSFVEGNNKNSFMWINEPTLHSEGKTVDQIIETIERHSEHLEGKSVDQIIETIERQFFENHHDLIKRVVQSEI